MSLWLYIRVTVKTITTLKQQLLSLLLLLTMIEIGKVNEIAREKKMLPLLMKKNEKQTEDYSR